MSAYFTIELSAAYGEATEVAVMQPPKLGGEWLFDLIGPQGLVQANCTAPAVRVAHAADITVANAQADIEEHLLG